MARFDDHRVATVYSCSCRGVSGHPTQSLYHCSYTWNFIFVKSESIHTCHAETEVPWRATSLPIVLDVLINDASTEISRSRAFALLPFHLTSPDLLERFFGHDRCATVMDVMLDHCMNDEADTEDRLEMLDLFEKLSIDSSLLRSSMQNKRGAETEA